MLLVISFLAGFVAGELYFNRQGSGSAGELDRQFAAEHGRATETIGRLAEELERERALSRELREYNHQAREITYGITGTTERNVRNLQEAISLIVEIREKLKVLENFYNGGGSGGGGA